MCAWLCVYSTSHPTIRLAEAGHKVVGVDISERAVKDFFTESHLSYEQVQVGKLVQYKVRNLTVQYTHLIDL